MSRLRELRVHGFKSFAEPTRFVFEPGVNALIGPNGSGKSNMADAVRWVLGEQSNRSLRTRRAEDVIFAGSDVRRAMGMAEVVLTLDNADGWLPLDFAEVSIGRRAYRSGETEYLLNGARARLRDVVELLAHGRLGANELVVVGQGTVDAALSLRPEERRQLFEEAAGVKNLQVKRNEASGRLAKARDHLSRVGDLVAELRPQVRRLALQARHQQEHDALLVRARTLIVESHRRREAAARLVLGEARRRAAAAEAALADHRAGEEEARRRAAAAEERYWAAEGAARAAARERERTREALIRADARLESLAARRDGLRAEIAAGHEQLAAARRTLAEAAADDPIDGVLARAAAAEEAWRTAITALARADAELLAAEERLAALRHSEASSIAAAARSDEERARLEARIGQVERELDAERRSAEELASGLAEALARSSGARERDEAARQEVGRAEAAHAEALADADGDRRRAGEVAQRAGVVRAELEALRERAEAAGRLGTLLAAAGWPTLLDELDAPPDAWPAVEAVVGGELEDALVWRVPEVAERLVEARGAARLLAPGRAAPDRAEALAAVGASGTLADWIGAGDDAPALFHHAAVAADAAALLRGWRSLPSGWCAVTPAGDLADGRGLLVLRGRAAESGAARRHARRRELAAQLATIESEHREAVAAAARSHAALVAAEKRREALRTAAEGAEARRREAERAQRDAEAAARQSARRQDELERTLAEARDALDRLPAPAAGRERDAHAVDEGERSAAEARRRREAAAAGRDAAREVWQDARSAAEAAEGRVAGLRQARALAEARLVELGARLPSLEAALGTVDAELAAAGAAADAAREADEAAGRARAGAEAERDARRAALREVERSGGDSVARLGELEREARDAAAAVSRAEEALDALARERGLALEALPDSRGIGDGEPSAPDTTLPAESRAEVAGLDDEALDAELRRVRRTLAQLGSVNPFAVDEHRELAERLEALTAQDADLRAAIRSTEELIGRLDGEIAERFNAAFAAIGERFDEYCRLLFAGGSASLELGSAGEGSDQGGIEIMVRPPGKRLSRLALLSGGERALAGVALLFAMLDVNPVPFCILDEVDAALDEANIGRFADALRRLAERIDFVVITHNRATIEVADTIYGVTMTDAAVSRVLSLRLGDVGEAASA